MMSGSFPGGWLPLIAERIGARSAAALEATGVGDAMHALYEGSRQDDRERVGRAIERLFPRRPERSLPVLCEVLTTALGPLDVGGFLDVVLNRHASGARAVAADAGSSLVQWSASGVALRRGGELAALVRQFEERHFVKLVGLVEPTLLADARTGIGAATFVPLSHGDAGRDHYMIGNPVLFAFQALVHTRAFLDLVEEICDFRRGSLKGFVGRVYQKVPGHHHDPWHSDVGQCRVAALSLNLGEHDYEGGDLELREAATHTPLERVVNRGAGDGVIFRVHPALQHRIGPMTGTTPKTAFAGWFVADGEDAWERPLKPRGVHHG